MYADLGLEEVPSYRIWNYEKQEFITIESKQIKIHLNYLTKELLKYESKIDGVAKNTTSLLENYYSLWWNEYRKYIEHNFLILKDKLNYYQGIDINITISKYKSLESKNISDSNLSLCVGLTNNNNNKANIIINNNIHDITFLDELYDDETDVIVTLAFDEDILKKDFEKMIESSIKITVNEEIINYYKRLISYEEYIIFCKKLFKKLDYKIDINNKRLYKYNFITDKNESYKLEFSQSASKEIVEDLGKRRNTETNLLILNKDILSHSVKKKYENENIYIKDIDDIFKIARNEIVFKNNDYLLKNIIYPYIEKEIGVVQKLENSTISDRLINDLQNCPLGQAGWKQFEEIILNIVKYIFENSFSNLLIKEQVRDESGTDIKDLIISNNGIHEFWKTIKHLYNSNNILIECKNYKSTIGIDELRQVSDYLEERAYGQFGIIFTRKGLDGGGIKKQLKYLRNKKMILVLNDNDIIELIKRRRINKSPEETFEYLKFDLETKV